MNNNLRLIESARRRKRAVERAKEKSKKYLEDAKINGAPKSLARAKRWMIRAQKLSLMPVEAFS